MPVPSNPSPQLHQAELDPKYHRLVGDRTRMRGAPTQDSRPVSPAPATSATVTLPNGTSATESTSMNPGPTGYRPPTAAEGPGAFRSLGLKRVLLARQTAAVSSDSAVSPLVMPGSTGMPGPIVVVIATFFRYLPLAAAGLSLMTSSSAAA